MLIKPSSFKTRPIISSNTRSPYGRGSTYLLQGTTSWSVVNHNSRSSSSHFLHTYQISSLRHPSPNSRSFHNSVELQADKPSFGQAISDTFKSFWGRKEKKAPETEVSKEEPQPTQQPQTQQTQQTQQPKQQPTQSPPPPPPPKQSTQKSQAKQPETEQATGFDVLGEKAKEMMGISDAMRLEAAVSNGTFNLEDYRVQLRSAKKLGGLQGMFKYIPGTAKFREMVDKMKEANPNAQEDEDQSIKILDAMTDTERKNPSLLIERGFQAKKRISEQCSCTIEDINRLLANFELVKLMYTKFAELKKQGKEIPNSMEGLMKYLMAANVWTKTERTWIQKNQRYWQPTQPSQKQAQHK